MLFYDYVVIYLMKVQRTDLSKQKDKLTVLQQ